MIILSIIISVIFLSIGIYYKSINDKNKDEYDTYKMYKFYYDLRYTHPSIYYNKIIRISKKLRKDKKIKPYEKKLITRYLHEYLRDEIRNGNNVDAYTNMLENDSLDDEELIFAFFTSTYDNTKKDTDNYNKEEISMMYYGFDDEKNDYFSNFDELQKNKSHNLKSMPEKLNKYCENLTSKNFKYDPAVGREKELEELMITILTPGKSALLLGKARCW